MDGLEHITCWSLERSMNPRRGESRLGESENDYSEYKE